MAGQKPGVPKGGNARAKPIIAGKQKEPDKIKIVAPDKVKGFNEEEYSCTSCGKPYKKQKGNFRATNSPMYANNNSYITVCNACIDFYEKQYISAYDGDYDKACERICQIFDWYVNESLLEKSRTTNNDRSRFSYIVSKGMLNPNVGKTYEDRIRELKKDSVISSTEALKELNESAGIKITQKSFKFWGTGYEPEDYVYLNERYAEWTSRHDCKTQAQERTFHKISIVELQIEKAIRDGKPIEKLMRTFNDLLGILNIKPVQNKDNSLADQNTFGTLIQKWENERPVPSPDPEWEDVDNIKKYIRVYFLGHLCKMLNINNSYSQLYDEEMAKYTVEKPEYDDESGANFDDMFGAHIQDKNNINYDACIEEDFDADKDG